jgi:hypothetical protein
MAPPPAPPQSDFGAGGWQPVGGDPFESVVGELLTIAERHLGPDAGMVEPILRATERTPVGLRTTISTLRSTLVAGHTEEVASMAHEMLTHVADRYTAAGLFE